MTRALHSPLPLRTGGLIANCGRVLLLGVMFLLLAGSGRGKEKEQATEYQLKAAFLYNFAKFIEWPEESFENKNSPFIVAVVGKDPFGKELESTFETKKVGGRKFVIKRFRRANEVEKCHLLFVPDTEVKRLSTIKKTIGEANVLLVGETKGFATSGGSVNFYTEKTKLRFEINPKAAERRGLEVSSKLLKIARVVEETGKSGGTVKR